MLAAYRDRGAELPLHDPSRGRAIGLEGFFWRITDRDRERVAVALVAINRAPGRSPWGLVALAAHPGGEVRTAALDDAWSDPEGPGLRVGSAVRADADGVRIDLGPGARLEVAFDEAMAWPRRGLGGMGLAQLAPGLSQYWHPHLLAAQVQGSLELGDATWSLDGASAYAEKNWGAGGMPSTWWWGQAHGFDRDDVAVAFAGGPARLGPVAVVGTSLVARVGDELVRAVRPLSPIAVEVDDRGWRLRAVTGRHRVEVEASAGTAPPVRLPVPVPGERRHVEGRSPQHLAGALHLRVRRGGRTLYEGTSTLAGLERGEGVEAGTA